MIIEMVAGRPEVFECVSCVHRVWIGDYCYSATGCGNDDSLKFCSVECYDKWAIRVMALRAQTEGGAG